MTQPLVDRELIDARIIIADRMIAKAVRLRPIDEDHACWVGALSDTRGQAVVLKAGVAARQQ